MEFPVMLGAGAWAVHPHVFFEATAYPLAFCIYLALRRRDGDRIADAPRWSIITAAAIGAVVGSRVLFWLEDPHLTAAHLRDPSFLIGGKTIVGGLLGGWIAVEIAKRRLGVRDRTGDLFVVPLAVGTAVGRIGCFLTGLDDHTYGIASSLPWAVDLGDGIPRHPTALYESVFMLVLAVVLARRIGMANGRAGTMRPGRLFDMFMVSYLAFRLAIDPIKPDPRVALGLTSIQWACIIGLSYYVFRLFRARHGHAVTERVMTT